MKRIIKVAITLILCICVVFSSIPFASASVVTNVITRNFTAIAFDYLERAVFVGLGAAINTSENEGITKVLSVTKKLLASPIGNSLSEITALCEQISTQIYELQGDLQASTTHISKAIQDLSAEANRRAYDLCHDQLVEIYTRYNTVYGYYENLVKALDAYAESPTDENHGKLKLAYSYVEDFYEAASESNPQTSINFNFNDDLDTILFLISPYDSSMSLTKLNGEAYELDDESAWGAPLNRTTYMDILLTHLLDGYIFEDDIYNNMVAGINEVASYASVFMTAYRMYVEVGTQLINSDANISESDREIEVSKLWNSFETHSNKLMRGLIQMMSLYDDELSTCMRSYDREYNLGIQRSQSMEVYQVKPYGGDTAYAIRMGGSETTNQDYSPVDMVYRSHRGAGPVNGIWHDKYALYYTFDDMLASTSPGGYQMIADASALSDILETPVYASSSGHFTSFLKSQGLTKLPDMYEINSNNYDEDELKKGWFLLGRYDSNEDVHHDDDTKWTNISQPLTTSVGTRTLVTLDTDDDIYSERDTLKNQKVLVVLSGKPKISLYTDISVASGSSVTAGDVKVYKSGSTSALGTGREVVDSGTALEIKVKPKAGQTIKSVTLVDGKNTSNVLCELVGNSIISGDTDGVAVQEILKYVDTDENGYYTFMASTPYRDARIQVTFCDEDPALCTYPATLVINETYGDIQFSGMNGLAEKEFKAGETVEISARPLGSYLVDYLVVKTADGTEIPVENITNTATRLTPMTKEFAFTMPSESVSVSAVYKTGYKVTFKKAENGSSSITNVDCLNTDWLKKGITFDVGETVYIATSGSAGYYNSSITVIGNKTYDHIALIPTNNGVRFTMPAESVSVSSEFAAIQPNEHAVTLKQGDGGYIMFEELNGKPESAYKRVFNEGESVQIRAVIEKDNYVVTKFSVIDVNDNTIPYTEENGVYTFTMGEENVTVRATYGYSVPEKSGGYYQISNASQLLWFAERVNAGSTSIKAKLVNDIDMAGIEWKGMGWNGNFKGVFDGGDYTIKNLNKNADGSYMGSDASRYGLFLVLDEGAKVQNLVIDNAVVWSGKDVNTDGSGVVAKQSDGTISSVIVSNSSVQLGAYDYLGGIVGRNNASGKIYNCAVVNSHLTRRWGGSTSGKMGGITQQNDGVVENCYVYGTSFNNGSADYRAPIVSVGNAPVNCYYYTTSTVNGTNGTAVDAERFETGEITWLLNGSTASKDSAWYQTIGAQQLPWLTGKFVVLYGTNYVNADTISLPTLGEGSTSDNGKPNIDMDNTENVEIPNTYTYTYNVAPFTTVMLMVSGVCSVFAKRRRKAK